MSMSSDEMPAAWAGFDSGLLDLVCQLTYRKRREGETWAALVSAAGYETPLSREDFVRVVTAYAYRLQGAAPVTPLGPIGIERP